MSAKFYAGIGSRSTPISKLKLCRQIAIDLRTIHGYTLRSGGAHGADQAFEAGACGVAQIFLPWAGFRQHASPLNQVSDEAMEIAKTYHPAWSSCSREAKLLHGRNTYQVLGADLVTPSDFIVCWTEGGLLKGGTAQAMRIARAHGIPIFNLAFPNAQKLLADYLSNPHREH